MAVERTFITDGKMPFGVPYITILETQKTYKIETPNVDESGNLSITNGADGTPHSADYKLGVGTFTGVFTLEYGGTIPARGHTFVWDGKGYWITGTPYTVAVDGGVKVTVNAHQIINPLVTFPAVEADLPTMVKDTELTGANLITATANTGAGTVTWTLVNAPTGISIDPSSGAITGTPTVAGDYQLEIIATGDSILNAIDPSTNALADAVGYRRYSLTVAASAST